jgi:hypothetical protein
MPRIALALVLVPMAAGLGACARTAPPPQTQVIVQTPAQPVAQALVAPGAAAAFGTGAASATGGGSGGVAAGTLAVHRRSGARMVLATWAIRAAADGTDNVGARPVDAATSRWLAMDGGPLGLNARPAPPTGLVERAASVVRA